VLVSRTPRREGRRERVLELALLLTGLYVALVFGKLRVFACGRSW